MAYGVERFFLLSYCLACCWPPAQAAGGARAGLRTVRQWAELDFQFPSEAARRAALQRRFYVPGNSVPIDVDVHYRGEAVRIFVTVPRTNEGRPITLGTVDESARVAAYPDYSWHDNQGQNCDGMTSVFRVAVDECNRLWVMDAGKIRNTQFCPPQLLAFDLDTDKLIYRHRVVASNYVDSSLFLTPVVDVRGSDSGQCSDTYVYVADESGFRILVVDVARDRSWWVTHRLMYPIPSWGKFSVVDDEHPGESEIEIDVMDGILGMALSPWHRGRDRYLFFHALSSTTENFVPTAVLRNESFIDNPNADPKSIHVFPEERTSQSAAEAMDRDGHLFFGLKDPPSIWCWNTATEFSPRNFHQVPLDKETAELASGMKVVNNLKGDQELWILTSSFKRVMTKTLRSDIINFRIQAQNISLLLENSPCKSPPHDQSNDYHANLITARET